jgi:hypothetical protein
MRKTITVQVTSYIEVDVSEDDLEYIADAIGSDWLSLCEFNQATGLDLDDTDVIDNADCAEVVEIS